MKEEKEFLKQACQREVNHELIKNNLLYSQGRKYGQIEGGEIVMTVFEVFINQMKESTKALLIPEEGIKWVKHGRGKLKEQNKEAMMALGILGTLEMGLSNANQTINEIFDDINKEPQQNEDSRPADN